MGLRCARSHPVLVLGVLGATAALFGVLSLWRREAKTGSTAEEERKAKDVAAKRERFKAWDEDVAGSEKQEESDRFPSDKKVFSEGDQDQAGSQSEAAEVSEELQGAETFSRDKKGQQARETSQGAAGGEAVSDEVPQSDGSLRREDKVGTESAVKAQTSGPAPRLKGLKKGFLSGSGSKKKPLKAKQSKASQQAKPALRKDPAEIKTESSQDEGNLFEASSTDTPNEVGKGRERITTGDDREENSQQIELFVPPSSITQNVIADTESGVHETPKKEMCINIEPDLKQEKSPKQTPTSVLSFPDSPSSGDSPLPMSRTPLKKSIKNKGPKQSAASEMGGLLPLPQRPQRRDVKTQLDGGRGPLEKKQTKGGLEEALPAATTEGGADPFSQKKDLTPKTVVSMKTEPASNPAKAHQQPSLLSPAEREHGASMKQADEEPALKPVSEKHSIEKNVEDVRAKNSSKVDASEEALGHKEREKSESEEQMLGRQSGPVEDSSSRALKQSPPTEEPPQTAEERGSSPSSSLSFEVDKASDLRSDPNSNKISTASQWGTSQPKDDVSDLETPPRVSETVSQRQEPREIEELPTTTVIEAAKKDNKKQVEIAIALAALAACAWCGRPLRGKEEDDLPLCCMLALQKLQEEKQKLEAEEKANVETKKEASKSGPIGEVLAATEDRRQNGRQGVRDAKPKAARRLNLEKAAREAAEGTRWALKVRSWLEGKTDSGRDQ